MADPNDPIPAHYPRTPDGRYFVADQKLWRCGNPRVSDEERAVLSAQLTAARALLKARNGADKALARKRIHSVKVALGELGPVWWNDDAPDYSRSFVRVTPYAGWYADLMKQGD